MARNPTHQSPPTREKTAQTGKAAAPSLLGSTCYSVPALPPLSQNQGRWQAWLFGRGVGWECLQKGALQCARQVLGLNCSGSCQLPVKVERCCWGAGRHGGLCPEFLRLARWGEEGGASAHCQDWVGKWLTSARSCMAEPLWL